MCHVTTVIKTKLPPNICPECHKPMILLKPNLWEPIARFSCEPCYYAQLARDFEEIKKMMIDLHADPALRHEKK